jgi:Mg2+ and Co2+ transporter CorA
MSWPHGYATIRDEQHKVNKEIDEAVTAIRAADNRAETDKATEQLQGILDRVFERDLEQREREVAEIEQRVAELRKQLQRRVSHKDEIVDLQMKVVLAEADGLGFYRDSQPSGGGFSFPALFRGQQTVPDQTRDRASGPVPTRNRPTSSERGNY